MGRYLETWRTVRSEFAASPKSTARWDAGNAIAGRWFYRPLGLLLAPAFILASVSGNAVTVLSCLVGTAGSLVFLLGRADWFLAGALLLVAFAVLDFTDGVVARHERKSTYFGKMLDAMSGVFVASFLPLTVGFGAARAGQLPAGVDEWLYLLGCGLAATVNLMGKYLSSLFAFERARARQEAPREAKESAGRESGLGHLLRRLLFHATATTSQLVLLALVLLGWTAAFPILLLLLAGLQLALAVGRILRRGPEELAIRKA